MVRRTIDGFVGDEEGDWVAELSCLHRQHVRHRPPFWDRPWVTTEDGRRARVGTTLDCPLCDRAELPDGLERARTAGPFDEGSLPAGLRRDHRVADRTWALVRVLDGSATFTICGVGAARYPAYKEYLRSYNDRRCAVSTSYVMKVSRNGQVSIPADARARWNAERVVVVDLGDRVVLRPMPDDPVGDLVGKYRGGQTTEEARRRARSDEATTARRKRSR